MVIFYRSGNSPLAAFRPIISAILATSTPSPSLPMALSVPPVVRTAPRCSGISTSQSISTLSKPEMRSTPLSSPPTDTGSALLPPPLSPSLTLRRRARLMNSNLTTSRRARNLKNHTLSAWFGALMVKPCSLVIPTTRSVLGVSCLGHKRIDEL